MNYFEQAIEGSRALLRDYAAQNKLLGNQEEYTDTDLRNALEYTLDEINHGDIYKTSYTVNTLMAANPFLLKLGMAKNAMQSKMVQKSRNAMPYSDGSGYVDKEGNLASYQAMYAQINQQYTDARVRWKAYLNVMAALN
jgi:hypothetical protein